MNRVPGVHQEILHPLAHSAFLYLWVWESVKYKRKIIWSLLWSLKNLAGLRLNSNQRRVCSSEWNTVMQLHYSIYYRDGWKVIGICRYNFRHLSGSVRRPTWSVFRVLCRISDLIKGRLLQQSFRKMLEGSQLISREKAHVQDPYSFRCIPQVHGEAKMQ